MRTAGILFAVLLIALAWTGMVQAQDEIMATIQKTTTPPTIDGVGNDPIWAGATPHGSDEFFNVESEGLEPDDELDLDVTWKALWDDTNLYLLVEVADEEILDDGCDHNADSIEVYVDAQNVDEEDYNPDSNPGVPAFQFRSVAGNNVDAICGADLLDNTSFNGGINSYDGDDSSTQYPQGEDDSVNVTADQATLDSKLAYSFEVSFPWEALEETPDNILLRGDMGFGVQVNDSDWSPGTRETMFLWAHDENDMWQRADAFPSVALSTEIVGGAGPPKLEAGDADQDLDFDQLDLVKVQISAKYLTGQAATWGDGDWNGAPGGEQGSPPAGNGFFDQLDIIAALNNGLYLNGPYAAIVAGGMPNDEQTSIIYNAETGEVAVDAPAGVELTSINIDSAGSIFTGDAAANLGGSFDNDADNNIFKATFGSSFASLSFGNVAQAGLSADFVAGDLTVVGSLAGGGDLGVVDLIYIPEPSTVVLLAVGLLVGLACRRRRK